LTASQWSSMVLSVITGRLCLSYQIKSNQINSDNNAHTHKHTNTIQKKKKRTEKDGIKVTSSTMAYEAHATLAPGHYYKPFTSKHKLSIVRLRSVLNLGNPISYSMLVTLS